MHLGRPLYAFRAVIGLQAFLAEPGDSGVRSLRRGRVFVCRRVLDRDPIPRGCRSLAAAVAATGFIGLFCSVMIYVFTGREFWSFGLTVTKFALTATVLGLAATLFSVVVHSVLAGNLRNLLCGRHTAGRHVAEALMTAGVAKLVWKPRCFGISCPGGSLP